MEDQTTDNFPTELLVVERVLLIDDDKDWCFVLQMLLQRAAIGKEILTAHNGREALTQLQTFATQGEKLPELIFLDIKMPVMDGFEFLNEAFKLADLDLSQSKIFICSSSFHPQDKEKAAQFPLAGFLTKPVTQKILKEILV